MTPDTAAALHRINREFYDRHAAAFSATRETPWPGWQRVAELVEMSRVGVGSRLSVLDLGCGNGRLARYLEGRWPDRLDYLGIDESASLLEIARAHLPAAGDRRFQLGDLLHHGFPEELPGAPFDLIAIFGLLHHLPGVDNRRSLIRRAAPLLAPGGLLAVSFWQFGDRERFRRRMVGWDEYNQTAVEPIDMADLEPGDLLLAWGEEDAAGSSAAAVRYCHWTRPAEAARLLAGLALETAAAYSADGAGDDLNLYRLLRARSG